MRSTCVAAFILNLIVAISASAAGPSLESVSPGIGQRGNEFELRIVGAGLNDAEECLLYSPGVTCLGLTAPSENELKIRLKAAADCRLGSHSFRVRTKQGLSELRTFRVTPFTVVIPEEPNETPAEARPVNANVTVAGVIESGDVDCFHLTLRRGDRLAAEVEAVRLGGPLVDTVLTVFGPDGSRLAQVDDTALFRQDPFVTIVAPEDGRYVVQVRESNYNGDENSRYALHIGTFPRPASVYPAGGEAGRTIKVTFGGDALGAFEQELQLPASMRDFPGAVALSKGLNSPTSNPFRVSPFPNVLEAEPNDDPAKLSASAAGLPVAFNGILQRAGDRDCFRFRAEEGVSWQFDALASRLGAPLDSVISIVDSTGQVLVSNDDEGTHDSRLMFTAPETGEYALCIRDKRGEGGENFVYRVEVTEPQPGLVAFMPRPERTSQQGQTIVVPRGNRVMAYLGTRRTRIEGDVRLAAKGMPVGVSLTETVVPADRFWMPVVVESKPDAPLAGALAEITATGRADDREIRGGFVQVVDLVAGSADALFEAAEVDRLAVAVVEDYPFKITLEEPKTTLAPDGTIGLRVKVERTADFEGPVEIKFPFLPPWVDGPASVTIEADQTTAVYTMRAFPEAVVREWLLCATALPGAAQAVRRTAAPVTAPPAAPPAGQQGRRRGRSRFTAPATPVATQLVSLHIAESPVAGTIGTVAAEQGKPLTVVCEIKRQGRLPEQMTATLEGLPNRVSAEPVTVTGAHSQVKFKVDLDPTAPIGSFPSLVCRLSGTIDGQEVSYCVGRGSVLRIEPAGALVTDESGRPLSPLEVLRRAQKTGEKKAPEKKAAEK